MIRLLHCSDLHLSTREREYGRAVLDGLFAEASERRVVAVFICGDLFDTFADAGELRGDVRAAATRYVDATGGSVFYLPGNHEALGRGRGDLARLDFGPVRLLAEVPFQFVRERLGDTDVELLAVPHSEQYGQHRTWEVPPRQAPYRLALAHGVVAGLSYTGPDEEEGAGILDPHLFEYHRVDYAALGHIHTARLEQIRGTTFCYPGSARVWRRGESGERRFALLELDQGQVRAELFPLACAGRYQCVTVPLGFSGEIPMLPDAELWRAEDYVELRLSGIVEDEHLLGEVQARLRAEYAARVRRLEITRDDVEVLPGIAAEPIARKFLELWAARAPQSSVTETEIWLRAREIALREIKRALDYKLGNNPRSKAGRN